MEAAAVRTGKLERPKMMFLRSMNRSAFHCERSEVILISAYATTRIMKSRGICQSMSSCCSNVRWLSRVYFGLDDVPRGAGGEKATMITPPPSTPAPAIRSIGGEGRGVSIPFDVSRYANSKWSPAAFLSVCGCVEGEGGGGCVGVWVCGCVGGWVCGCVGVWVCGVNECTLTTQGGMEGERDERINQ